MQVALLFSSKIIKEGIGCTLSLIPFAEGIYNVAVYKNDHTILNKKIMVHQK